MADSTSSEQRGEDVSGRLIFAPEDAVSLSLEYLPPGTDPLNILCNQTDIDQVQNVTSLSTRRYLQCPALVTIAHLKKFLALKYSVDMTHNTIEICHRRAPLPENWTLMDVAYIYAWKRNAPMRFFYRVAQEEQRLEAPPYDRPSTPGPGASLPPTEVSILSEDVNNLSNISSNVDLTKSDLKIRKLSTNDSNISSEERNISSINHVFQNVIGSDLEESSVLNDNHNLSDKIDELEKSASGEVDNLKSDMISQIKDISSGGSVHIHKLKYKETTKTDVCERTGTNDLRNEAVLSNKTNNDALISSANITTGLSCKNVQEDGMEIKCSVKSPIKILKNSDGGYEVLRGPSVVTNIDDQANNPNLKTAVTLGNGKNFNGVKINSKQYSSGPNRSKKPKVISNILLRCGQVDRDSTSGILQQLQKDKINKGKDTKVGTIEILEKAEEVEKSKKIEKPENENRRKVTFVDTLTLFKTDGEIKSVLKKSPDHPDKKQFLQSFQLTVKNCKSEAGLPASNTDTSKPAGKSIFANNSPKLDYSDDKNINKDETAKSDMKLPSSPIRVAVGVLDDGNIPKGAVKRKCPPGLPIFDIKRRRRAQGSSPRKTPLIALIKSSQKAPDVVSSTNICGRVESGPMTGVVTEKFTPMLSNDTRNLLDGCGLNIPASLSITLTAPKSPGGSIVPEQSGPNDSHTIHGKVNPSITLNDRSVDPLVLKALKSGQIRMPTSTRPKVKPGEPKSITKKRDHDVRDVLDLSGKKGEVTGKKTGIHPLRIPQPVSKQKGKPICREAGQFVTLTGGQRFYRTPPGSLTPAAHRVDVPIPSRMPVYAPSCLTSPRSNNLSSVFPSLQSLYALSQAPNLQQFQIDSRMQNLKNEGFPSPSKSHLAAQCPPVKPARSSIAPLAVPIIKQTNESPSRHRLMSSTKSLLNTGTTTEDVSTLEIKITTCANKDNQCLSSPTIIGTVSSDHIIQDAASPRVSSTASPSPPLNANSSANSETVFDEEEKSSNIVEKNNSMEEVSSSKNPVSPDSSSVVTEILPLSFSDQDVLSDSITLKSKSNNACTS
ncbi:uncharacterized protein LOC107268368 [Cephus cinctus]|uniref:Uncharacterized protein LOC107268368 n=1 Tax=Cephus cinctus TaxID=211228 RepID=A0AAJ7BX69_CEPCN|nr:uncharacterized protein LOC107268368 [Cephus cinctus]